MPLEYWPIQNVDFKYLKDPNAILIELHNTENLSIGFFEYGNKFMSAANVLANHVVSIKSHAIRDTWFFPIVYLYRQSLELIIKAIAFKYIIEKDERKAYVDLVKHDVVAGYQTIISNFSTGNFISTSEDNWLQLYLKDITQWDKESDAFRYPFSTSMKKFFEKELHIDLRKLCENMNVAYTILRNVYSHETNPSDITMRDPVLLATGGHYYDTCIIGWQFSLGNDFYPYVNGYNESANYLSNLAIEGNTQLFLPMCYLYRNGIELALKRILIERCDLQANKHGVVSIWNKISRTIADHASVQEDDETLLNVKKYLEQLNKLDSTSSTFRYPADKYLNLHFKKKTKLDIINISSRFKELFYFLDSVDLMISVHQEWEKEMDSHWEREY